MKRKKGMKKKFILIFATTLICCSPNSKTEDELLGKWNNVSIVYATGINPNDPTNTIIVWDTINYGKEIEIKANEIRFNLTANYKKNTNLSQDTTFVYSYSKLNDTLTIARNNKTSYYKYKISNDSLTMNYAYGDTIKFDSLTSEPIMKFKKE
jgi:hypothetical protein